MGSRSTSGSDGLSGGQPPTRTVIVKPAQPTIEDLEREIRILRAERDDYAGRFHSIPRATQFSATQLAEAEKALMSIRQARDAVVARSAELSEKLHRAHDTVDDLTDRLELAIRARDAALEQLHTTQTECADLKEKLNNASPPAPVEDEAVLAKVQKQLATARSREDRAKTRQKQSMAHLIEQFSEERKRLQQQFDRLKNASDVQIYALQAQLVARNKESASPGELDRQKLQIADLRAELDALREDLRQARLPEPLPPVTEAAPIVAFETEAAQPLAAVEIDSELEAMRLTLLDAENDPSNFEALDVLISQFQDFSRRAISAGRPAAHRVATTCGDVAAWLRRTPKKIAATCKPLNEARQLLGALMKAPADVIGDPAGATIYAVDDDVDNCECMAMALEKVALHTRYAMKADVALAELKKSPYDLIILDVDLGGATDGFELHRKIREIDHHRTTPVLFVSGHLAARDRLGELTGHPENFVAKPYNLNELALKTLGTLLKSRLDTASAA